MVKVSVIVPIYCVEKHIEKCAKSLFEQTIENVEFIFIDDCTPDNSISLLKETLKKYPQRESFVKIIHHETNKGLPAARNTGLSHANGEYIFHCDSDDFVEPNMLEEMYNAAIKNNAEFVWCDWYLSYNKKERLMTQPAFSNTIDTIEGMLYDAMKYNVWNKLIKKSVYYENSIEFPYGHSMGEDMTIIMLAACSKRVVHISKAFYHYVKTNNGAMTYHLNKKALDDLNYNVKRITDYLRKSHPNVTTAVECFKLNVKLPFLISENIIDYKRWAEWYPESNDYIWENKHIAFRTKFLEFMASKNQWWYIKLYNIILYKIIYSILFK